MESSNIKSSGIVSNPETWVDQHGDFLYRFALIRVRNPKVAEDLVQETFLAALKSREKYVGKSSERTWFAGILKHKIIDHFRESARERPVTDYIIETEDAFNNVYDNEGRWKIPPKQWLMDPGKVYEQNEFWNAVHSCLKKLKSRIADIFVLREMEGMSTDEICNVMNISKSNLWVILHRARHQLRDCLETNWFETGKKT